MRADSIFLLVLHLATILWVFWKRPEQEYCLNKDEEILAHQSFLDERAGLPPYQWGWGKPQVNVQRADEVPSEYVC